MNALHKGGAQDDGSHPSCQQPVVQRMPSCPVFDPPVPKLLTSKSNKQGDHLLIIVPCNKQLQGSNGMGQSEQDPDFQCGGLSLRNFQDIGGDARLILPDERRIKSETVDIDDMVST